MIQFIRLKIGKRWNALKMAYQHYNSLVSYFGSSDKYKTKEKERAFLLMELHVIEKGLSLKDVRVGFGIPKVRHVLKLAIEFFNKYDDYTLLNYVLAPITEYIDFHNASNFEIDSKIAKDYDLLKKMKIDNQNKYNGGTKNVTKKEILHYSNIDFKNFANYRFSIRNYTGESVDREKIEQAFIIAQKTPSPCNRQPWNNFLVYDKNLIDKIITLQQGGRQFKNDLSCIILVTSTYNHFYGSEHYQPQVSGGMYAMSLIYALHSLGLGTIPLNLGIDKSKIDKIYNLLGVGFENAPILIIGVGDISEYIKVAFAERFDYKDYTTIFE
jgi:nitroreductase